MYLWNNLRQKKIFPCLFREPLRQTAPIKVTGDNKVTFAPSTNIHQSKLDGRVWTEKKLTHIIWQQWVNYLILLILNIFWVIKSRVMPNGP